MQMTATMAVENGEYANEHEQGGPLDSSEEQPAAADDGSSFVNYRSSILITSAPQSNDGDQAVNTREESSAAVTKSADNALANETIKLLAYLLTNARREASVAIQGPENAISLNVMRGLMNRAPTETLQNNSHREIVEYMGTTCGILEMMFRHSIANLTEMYESIGSSVILLLLQIIDHCLPSAGECYDDANDDSEMRGARDCVDRSTEIFCHFARIPEARVSMANLPGVINGVLRVVESRFSEESHTNAVWVIANLACAKRNLSLMASQPGLLDALVRASKPGPAAEPGCVHGASAASNAQRHSRKQAVRALMNLTVSGRVQASLSSNDDRGLVEVMLDIMRLDPNPQTRGFAAATIVNMANAKDSAAYMIGLRDGSFLLEVVRTMQYEGNNSLTVSYCLETLRLIAAGGGAVEMCSCPELLEVLADVAVGGQSGDKDAVLAASTLKRLAMHMSEVTVGTEAESSIESEFLGSLVKVVMGVDSSFIDVLGRVGDALAEHSQHAPNRRAMIRHEGLFGALCKLSAVEGTARCARATVVVVRRLSEMVQDHSLLGTDACVDTVANLLCRTDLDDTTQIEVLELTSKLASTASCHRLMSSNERLMVALVTHATQLSLTQNDTSTQDFSRANVRDTIVRLMSAKNER